MIKGLAHIAVTAEDMDKSLHFYRDILGLKHAFNVKDENGDPWIEYIQAGPQQFIEIFHGGKTKVETVKNQIGMHHLCLRVDDIQQIADRLESYGVSLDVPPKRGLGKNYQCWVTDPDGNKIEFIQPDDDSPHMAE